MRIRHIEGWLLALLGGALISGCAGAGQPPEETADDLPNAGATSTEIGTVVAADEGTAAAPAARVAVVTGVAVSRVEVERAEDGRGNLVAAVAPVAIEIAAEAWPVRALDPVLRIGDLEFRHYTFPRINVLRYVAADAAALPTDAAVTVQYGDDESSLVVAAERLEVPR